MIPTHESDLERELFTQLIELVDSPAAPSSVDAGLARRSGRRRLRARRAATAGGVATVAAALGLGLMNLPTSHGSSVASPPAQSVGGHDTLLLQGSFGWLPASLKHISYVTGEEPPASRASDGGANIAWLTVYPKGVTPPLGKNNDGRRLHYVPGPRVNHAAGQWLVDNSGVSNGEARTLRWKTSTGAWAEVSVVSQASKIGKNVIPAISDATIQKIAEHARTGAQRTVPLPYHIADLPAGLRLTGGYPLDAGGTADDGLWETVTTYQAQGSSSYVTLKIRTNHGKPPVPGPKTGSRCVTAHSLDLCVDGNGKTLDAFGGMTSLLGRITLIGPA